MEIRVIKAKDDYHVVLHEAERLVAKDPMPDTADANRLELLTVLIEDYEKRAFPLDAPDPIEAIEFRMDEQGLRQKDLIPLIGSRSRVSEVLARKRPLTIQMIRSLSLGLGIPVETLIAEPAPTKTSPVLEPVDFEWKKFPLKDMEKRGWLASLKTKANASAEEIVRAFLAQVSSTAPVMFRRRFRGEEIDERSYYTALAWTARVLIRARDESRRRSIGKFDPSKINSQVFRDLAQLSWFAEGPRLAIEFLAKHGIATIIEPKLANTLIDGVAMLSEAGNPVIGLTLRYDRADYFWFTLLHEVAHVCHHLNTPEEAFIDRLENMGTKQLAEKEANRVARESFVPRGVWKRSNAFLSPSKEHILELADELHIHPAMAVGRLHYETGRFDSFRDLLGQGTIRKYFPEISFK